MQTTVKIFFREDPRYRSKHLELQNNFGCKEQRKSLGPLSLPPQQG